MATKKTAKAKGGQKKELFKQPTAQKGLAKKDSVKTLKVSALAKTLVTRTVQKEVPHLGVRLRKKVQTATGWNREVEKRQPKKQKVK